MDRPPIRVAVAGALGRMGTTARDVLERDPGVAYAGGLARTARPDEGIVTSLDAMETLPDVLLDLSVHPASVAISLGALARGVRVVIGATGWNDAERERLRDASQRAGVGAMLVPNFSIGAALMMRFAQEAAPFFNGVEIIELHHDKKQDAPSGTARLTADRIAARTGVMVPIHSVRLRGLLAHQEVLLGTEGEVLTIRHDSLSRESFAAGMLACVHRVMELRELEIGLDAVIAARGGASSHA